MLVFQKTKKHVHFNLQNGKSAQRNVSRSEVSNLLSREALEGDRGMFKEHFTKFLWWKNRNLK